MMMVDGDELKRLRALERVVLNQLGLTDPRQVAEWIVDARKIMDAAFPPPPEPQPQADGEPSEQDVIGLQRAYTASAEEQQRDYIDNLFRTGSDSRGSC